MVLGGISLGFWPLGPVALYLGVRARRQARERDQDGDGYALIGAITGGIATAMLALAALASALILMAFISPGDRSEPDRGVPMTSTSSTLIKPSTSLGPVPTLAPRDSPGTSRSPQAAVPPAVCARLRSSLDDLSRPEGSTPNRLITSATTIRNELGPVYDDDVVTVFDDAVARNRQPGQPPRPQDVIDALKRVEAAIHLVCGR
jgi:hypothetical protein